MRSDSSAAHAPRAEQGETVLVIDDEHTLRMLITEVGYAALQTGNGPGGLRILQSDVRIDLMLPMSDCPAA